jgi:DNA recombination protein RmuC
MLIGVLIFVFGLAAGSLVVWLLLRSGSRALLADLNRLQTELQEEHARLSVAEVKAARISDLETERTRLTDQIDALQMEGRELSIKLSRAETQNDEQLKAAQEKLLMLHNAKEELTLSFQNLADKIFNEKSERLNQTATTSISGLLTPFGERIKQFEAKVNEIYNSESRERFSLEKEVRRLAELNVQMSQDAADLTNALKGQTRIQGELGQIILETILEKSGLLRDQEYVIQKSLTNEEGRRFRPDVIVYLPDNRQLIIDSKVNLPTYQEYSSLKDGPEREAVLSKHIAAFRRHISDLEKTRYQDLYKLNSLDFVLMFVPFEGAFSLAMLGDPELFDYAFEKNVIIVTRFTLAATIRTVANIWKQEYQSQNALKIAKQASRLYEKFVLFYEDLSEIGNRLEQAQNSYDAACKKLMSGKGNLIKRATQLIELGAKASKRLPGAIVAEAFEDNDNESVPMIETAASQINGSSRLHDDSTMLLPLTSTTDKSTPR